MYATVFGNHLYVSVDRSLLSTIHFSEMHHVMQDMEAVRYMQWQFGNILGSSQHAGIHCNTSWFCNDQSH